MSTLLKKIILVFCTSFLLLSSSLPLAAAVHAQTWYNQNPFEWYIKVYDENTSPSNEIFGERYTAAQVQWVMYSLLANVTNLPFLFIGMRPTPYICLSQLGLGTINIPECFGVIGEFILAARNKIISMISYTPNMSPVATVNQNTSILKKIFLEERPISGIGYIRNIGRKLTLVPTAQAASATGFNKLVDAVSDLWKITRNIAYFLFVIVTIVIAFMIMFKVKLNPQTVITIQSALPKIFISMILVTFSLAIAGFLIDLVYVVMGLFSLLFVYPSGVKPIDTFNFINGLALGEGSISIFIYSVLLLILFFVASWLTIISAAIHLNPASYLFALLLMIFTIILIVVLVINFFVVLFNLFKALAGFYVSVILGPIQLAMGALPGSQNSFGNWIKGLISKLAVFPATGILYYVSYTFIVKSITLSFATIVDVPDFIPIDKVNEIIGYLNTFLSRVGFTIPEAQRLNLWGPPMLGNGTTASSIAFILIGVSCIMLIPKVNKMIESALAGKPFDMESAIAEPVKTAIQTGGSGVEAWGASWKHGSDPGRRATGAKIEGAGTIMKILGR